MATARRRIIRPNAEPPPPDRNQQRRLQKLRTRLQTEQAALDRWWKRLRRALNAVEKHQRMVKSLERQIAQHGDSHNGQDH
jgi:hypothetical protein